MSIAVGGIAGAIAGPYVFRTNGGTSTQNGALGGGLGIAAGVGIYFGVQFFTDPWIPMDYDGLLNTLNSFGFEEYVNRKKPKAGASREGFRSRELGLAFEKAVLQSMAIKKNDDDIGRDPNTGKTEPDGIKNGVEIFVNEETGEPTGGGRWWEQSVLIDAKTSKNGQIRWSEQIERMLDWISNINMGYETTNPFIFNGQFPTFAGKISISATSRGAGVLHLVTPAGTTIAPKLLQEAHKRGVIVLQSTTMQHRLRTRRIYVTKPERVNLDGSTSPNIPEGFRNKGGRGMGILPDFR